VSVWSLQPVGQFGLFGLSTGHVVLELHSCFTTRTQLFRTFGKLHIPQAPKMRHWVFKDHQTLHTFITYDIKKGIARICDDLLIGKHLEISIWWNFDTFLSKNTLLQTSCHTHRGYPIILTTKREVLVPGNFYLREGLQNSKMYEQYLVVKSAKIRKCQKIQCKNIFWNARMTAMEAQRDNPDTRSS
jgi:hypothetical protein